MEIRVIDEQMATTDGLLMHIHGRVARALNRWEPRVRRVEVHLADINGPKGGKDKRCIIQARLRAGDPLIVEETGDEFYPAIDSAIARLKRVVSRVVDRRKHNGTRR
jgi:putative sigma-54 modulation protein